MDIKWLEDLAAVSRSRTLFEAAQARNVTHPAFGRRIRALEQWAGVALITRGSQRVALTAAGHIVLEAATEVLQVLQDTKLRLQEPGRVKTRQLLIASGRTLAHSILPRLVGRLQPELPPFQLKVVTTSLNFGIDMLVDNEVDFLLCHAHQPLYEKIDNSQFVYRTVGADTLIAVSRPLAPGHAKFRVPKTAADPVVPFLDYASSMSLGKILHARLSGICAKENLTTVYEADLADAIHAMAIEGFGLAWLPSTLVENDLASGALVRADQPHQDVAMEIRLYKSAENTKSLSRQFWQALLNQPATQG